MNDPNGQQPHDAPDRPGAAHDDAPVGVAAADEARARLRAMDEEALDTHVEAFEEVHRLLQEGLADLDEG